MPELLVPVTVVTGFLGAGKSTLVERWLGELPRDDVAVIVNERGEVGIDGELLAAHVARVREITGGCVCCESQAELTRALAELSATTPPPKRIVVETSGAASPAGVIRALGDGTQRLRLDGVVTVFDVTRAAQTLTFDLAAEQLGFADVVVLSHVDRAEREDCDIDAAQAAVGTFAPAAVIAQSRRGAMSTTFLELLDQRRDALRMPARGSGHAVIEAVSLVVDGELDEERFGRWVESALGDVGPRILRMKGILAMQGIDVRVILQGVGDAVEVLFGAPWGDAPRNSRLVVLGLGLDAEALEEGFAAARASHSA